MRHPYNQSPAEDARDDAVERVGNSHKNWIALVVTSIRRIPKGLTFNTDDLWEKLEYRALPPPAEPRAMGAAIMHARHLGLIENTEGYRKSKRRKCHARPIPTWKRL